MALNHRNRGFSESRLGVTRFRSSAKAQRIDASKVVFAKKKGLVKFYEDVKKSIDQEIGKYGTDLGSYNISIEARLRFSPQFPDEFFGFVSQAVKGSFYGTDDGKAVLRELARLVSDWESESEVFGFLEAVDHHMHSDQRAGQSEDSERDIFKQMRQKKEPVDLYDYLFGFDYLETKYDLKIDGKDLKVGQDYLPNSQGTVPRRARGAAADLLSDARPARHPVGNRPA